MQPALSDKVKDMGGKPFLTDSNTLYYGRRANAVDHLEAAMENGFNRIAVGCDVIIADGLTGGDAREIPIDMKHVENAKIGTIIADSDVIISLTHFKGHEQTGFGGSVEKILVWEVVHARAKWKCIQHPNRKWLRKIAWLAGCASGTAPRNCYCI